MTSFADCHPVLPALTSSLIPAVGADSIDTPPVQAIRVLAEDTDTEVAVFPGGHLGHLSDPTAFATRLTEVLST